jgi:hypothetical protein
LERCSIGELEERLARNTKLLESPLTAQLPGGDALLRTRHEELQKRLDELRGVSEIGRGIERTHISDKVGGGRSVHDKGNGFVLKTEELEDVEMMRSSSDDNGSGDVDSSRATRRHRGWNSLPVGGHSSIVILSSLFYLFFLTDRLQCGIVISVIASQLASAGHVAGRIATAPGSGSSAGG